MPFDLSSLYGGAQMDPRMAQMMQYKMQGQQVGQDMSWMNQPGALQLGPDPRTMGMQQDQRYVPQMNHPGFPPRGGQLEGQGTPRPVLMQGGEHPQLPPRPMPAPQPQQPTQAPMRRPNLSSLRPPGAMQGAMQRPMPQRQPMQQRRRPMQQQPQTPAPSMGM